MTIPELVAEARTQSEAAVGLVAELGGESITRTAVEALVASSAALADAIEILSET